jgi:hypothetical protein
MSSRNLVVPVSKVYRAVMLFGALCGLGAAPLIAAMNDRGWVIRVGGALFMSILGVLFVRAFLNRLPWLVANEEGIQLPRMRIAAFPWSKIEKVFLKRHHVIVQLCFVLDGPRALGSLSALLRLMMHDGLVGLRAIGVPVGYRTRTGHAILEKVFEIRNRGPIRTERT